MTADLTIAKLYDPIEFQLPAWTITIEFASGDIHYDFRTKTEFRRIPIEVTKEVRETWRPVQDWRDRLEQLCARSRGQDESFSSSFSHPTYRLTWNGRVKYLYPSGMIALLADRECRIPLRMVVGRLKAMRSARV